MTRQFVLAALLAVGAAGAAAQVPAADPAAATLPEGYQAEIVVKDLTYPTSVEFDGDGAMYVVEAGYSYGDPTEHPDVHDVPAHPIRLRQRSFTSDNPLAKGSQQVRTGAFQPFGQPVADDATVPGATKANGTIMRMNPDGSELEGYAWGLRNPFGVMWNGDKLYASENGFDVRGSRPIANDKEDLYEIKEGAWYGWPDYASGLPVTDARFAPKNGPAPAFLMADHPPVEKPLVTFPEHSAAAKLAVSPEGFGEEGEVFIAFFGHMAPMTGTVSGEHGGHPARRGLLARWARHVRGRLRRDGDREGANAVPWQRRGVAHHTDGHQGGWAARESLGQEG